MDQEEVKMDRELMQDSQLKGQFAKDEARYTMQSMEKIRQESISDKKISPGKHLSYLEAAKELSLELQKISDPKISAKIQSISDCLAKDKSLLNYDPLNNADWKNNNSDFVHTLNEILIAVEEDKFFTTNDNYHIFQAIKMLSDIKNTKYKNALETTILPMQVELELKNDSAWKRLGAFFAGETYDLEKVDGSTLKLNSDITMSSLDALISKLDGKGYHGLRLEIDRDDLTKLKKSFPTVKTVTKPAYKGNNIMVEVEIPIGDASADEAPATGVDTYDHFKSFRSIHSPYLFEHLTKHKSDSIATYFENNGFQDGMSTNWTDKSVKSFFSKDYDAVTFAGAKKIDDFSKYSVLVYKNNNRNVEEYMLTAITSDYRQSQSDASNIDNKVNTDDAGSDTNNKLDDNTIISKIIEILTSKEDTLLKLEVLTDGLAPNYIRLRKWSNGNVVKDYGGVGWYD